jgi:hypothetical protein
MMIRPHRGPHLLRFGIRVVTPPTQEQFDVPAAKAHLRINHSFEDAWLDSFIPVAREMCEQYLAIAIAPQTLEFWADSFPSSEYHHPAAGEFDFSSVGEYGVLLPMGPITDLVSVSYYDTTGTLQVMDPAGYFLDDVAQPSALYPVDLVGPWPDTWQIQSAVRIRFDAGYDKPMTSPAVNPMPESVKAAMLLTLGHLHENREDTTTLKLAKIPSGAQSLMDPYCLRKRFA